MAANSQCSNSRVSLSIDAHMLVYKYVWMVDRTKRCNNIHPFTTTRTEYLHHPYEIICCCWGSDKKKYGKKCTHNQYQAGKLVCLMQNWHFLGGGDAISMGQFRFKRFLTEFVWRPTSNKTHFCADNYIPLKSMNSVYDDILQTIFYMLLFS